MLPRVQECPKEKESIKEATVMSTNNPPRQFVNWTETLPRQTYSKDPVTSVSFSSSNNKVSVSVLIGMMELIFVTSMLVIEFIRTFKILQLQK